MGKQLLIAEKSSMAGLMAKALGAKRKPGGSWESDSLIIACASGHMLRDPSPSQFTKNPKGFPELGELPIIPEPWVRTVDDSKKKQWKMLQDLLLRKDVDGLIHAGDPDDEGQRIVDDIINGSKRKFKNIKRMLCGARAEAAIKKAFANLKDNDDYVLMGVAADCRSKADWIVGMNYSIFYRSLLREKNISFGRVQTPTVYLVLKREDEISNFKPQTYYLVNSKCWLDDKDTNFSASFSIPKDADYVDSENRIIEKSTATQIASEAGTSAIVTEATKKKAKQNAPKGYTQTELQVDAGQRFGLSPEKTMASCQGLYLKEVISYPRSKRNEYEKGDHADAKAIIKGVCSIMNTLAKHETSMDTSLVSPAWTSKEYEHYALAPILTTFSKFNHFEGDEEVIYMMIAERYFMQFFPAATSYKMSLLLNAGNNHQFRANASVPIDEGWRVMLPKKSGSKALPTLNEGDTVNIAPSVSTSKTKAPLYYTEASLVAAMAAIHHHVRDDSLRKRLESHCEGIGTDATRYTIPANAIKKEQLVLDGNKKLRPTDKLRRMMDIADDSICYPDTTAVWDLALEMIKEGKQTPEVFLESVMSTVEDVIFDTDIEAYIPKKEYGNPCPICKKRTVKVKGKYGIFYGCEIRECKGILDSDGKVKKPFEKTKGDPENPKCPDCESNTVKKVSKKGNGYFSCEDFPDCKGIAFEETIGLPCPKCGEDTVLRTSAKGDFYSCKKYPKCKGVING